MPVKGTSAVAVKGRGSPVRWRRNWCFACCTAGGNDRSPKSWIFRARAARHRSKSGANASHQSKRNDVRLTINYSLALGLRHFSLYRRLWPWDHAAGVLIHEEAGGYSALLDGSPYRPTRTQPWAPLRAGQADVVRDTRLFVDRLRHRRRTARMGAGAAQELPQRIFRYEQSCLHRSRRHGLPHGWTSAKRRTRRSRSTTEPQPRPKKWLGEHKGSLASSPKAAAKGADFIFSCVGQRRRRPERYPRETRVHSRV